MNFFLTIIIFFITAINSKNIESQEKLENEIINISVNGLVCDFCARSIEKLIGKNKSVQNININLETMMITISLKNGANLDDNSIKQVITDSGYDVVEINREK